MCVNSRRGLAMRATPGEFPRKPAGTCLAGNAWPAGQLCGVGPSCRPPAHPPAARLHLSHHRPGGRAQWLGRWCSRQRHPVVCSVVQHAAPPSGLLAGAAGSCSGGPPMRACCALALQLAVPDAGSWCWRPNYARAPCPAVQPQHETGSVCGCQCVVGTCGCHHMTGFLRS